jgi:fucose 4-O-acetylase-like acetyltransferase
MAHQTEIDAFKGILICLITLGHNIIFSTHFPDIFGVLYNFHVASFLILPFLFFGSSSARYQFKDRATRYLVPHSVFLLLSCVAFFALFSSESEAGLAGRVQSVLVAVIFSSEGLYRLASGFGFFWFLPALLMLVTLRTAYLRGGFAMKSVMVIGSCGVHLTLGLLPVSWLSYIPWGLPIILFLFPVGLVVGALWKAGMNSRTAFAGSVILFLICIFVGLNWPSKVGLAGDPKVYAIDQPLRLIFHDVYLISAFFCLLMLCWYLPNWLRGILAYIGKRSLFVFLVHSFVLQIIYILGGVTFVGHISKSPLIQVSISFLFTILFTLFSERIFAKASRLCSAVFPTSFNGWKKTICLRF